MESIKNVKSKINAYGNVDSLPKGWKLTNATVTQLDAAKVAHVKVLLGFDVSGYGSHKYYKPILQNAVYGRHWQKLQDYLKGRKKTKQKPYKRAIEKYAEYMTDDEELQQEIIYEYENNRDTGGTAWKMLSQGYREGDEETMWYAYRLMSNARDRHENTNYDELLKRGWSREDARAAIRY